MEKQTTWKNILAAHLRPSLAARNVLLHETSCGTKRIHCSPKEGGGAPTGALCMIRACEARLRVQRDALASRRSTAALATDKSVAQPQNRVSSKTAPEGVLPAGTCLELSELLADRSFCRSSGDPRPPGSGVTSPTRGHRSRSTSRIVSRSVPRRARCALVTDMATIVNEFVTISETSPL
jgi:hypothetical protein